MGYKATIPGRDGQQIVGERGEWRLILALVPTGDETEPIPIPEDGRLWGFVFPRKREAERGLELLTMFVTQFNRLEPRPDKPELAAAVRDVHNKVAGALSQKTLGAPAFQVISAGIGAWVEDLAAWAPSEPPTFDNGPGAHDHLGARWPEPITQQSALEHAHRRHFLRYRKKTLTDAIRMAGPFTVETTEGPLTCSDGYLAIDSRGFPYPIDREEFETIYEQVQ